MPKPLLLKGIAIQAGLLEPPCIDGMSSQHRTPLPPTRIRRENVQKSLPEPHFIVFHIDGAPSQLKFSKFAFLHLFHGGAPSVPPFFVLGAYCSHCDMLFLLQQILATARPSHGTANNRTTARSSSWAGSPTSLPSRQPSPPQVQAKAASTAACRTHTRVFQKCA